MLTCEIKYQKWPSIKQLKIIPPPEFYHNRAIIKRLNCYMRYVR